MRILVTGASGFVGQHLLKFLSNKTNFLVGTYRNHKPAPASYVKYRSCDFLDRKSVLTLIKKVKPTHIIHLVGQSSPSLSWKLPYETIEGNVFSTINLLDACRELNLRPKVLYISSAHVYGQSFYEKRQLDESVLPKPMDPYATSKIQAEYFVLQYWYQFKIPSVIIRASAHTGIGQPPFFVMSNFSKQIAEIEKGERAPILYTGNLEVERGFVDVEDVCRAYWLALQKAKPGEIYNVGALKVRKMRDWLRDLLKLTNEKIEVRMDPARKRLKEPIRIAINSQKFRKISGWREQVPIDKTIRDVLNWWRKNV